MRNKVEGCFYYYQDSIIGSKKSGEHNPQIKQNTLNVFNLSNSYSGVIRELSKRLVSRGEIRALTKRLSPPDEIMSVLKQKIRDIATVNTTLFTDENGKNTVYYNLENLKTRKDELMDQREVDNLFPVIANTHAPNIQKNNVLFGEERLRGLNPEDLYVLAIMAKTSRRGPILKDIIETLLREKEGRMQNQFHKRKAVRRAAKALIVNDSKYRIILCLEEGRPAFRLVKRTSSGFIEHFDSPKLEFEAPKEAQDHVVKHETNLFDSRVEEARKRIIKILASSVLSKLLLNKLSYTNLMEAARELFNPTKNNHSGYKHRIEKFEDVFANEDSLREDVLEEALKILRMKKEDIKSGDDKRNYETCERLREKFKNPAVEIQDYFYPPKPITRGHKYSPVISPFGMLYKTPPNKQNKDAKYKSEKAQKRNKKRGRK